MHFGGSTGTKSFVIILLFFVALLLYVVLFVVFSSPVGAVLLLPGVRRLFLLLPLLFSFFPVFFSFCPTDGPPKRKVLLPLFLGLGPHREDILALDIHFHLLALDALEPQHTGARVVSCHCGHAG